MAKQTFSLDDQPVDPLKRAALREVLLPDSERDRLLVVLRGIRNRPPTRPRAAVERELKEIRRTRRWR